MCVCVRVCVRAHVCAFICKAYANMENISNHKWGTIIAINCLCRGL